MCGFVLLLVVDAARRVGVRLGTGTLPRPSCWAAAMPIVTLHDLSEVQLRMLRLAFKCLSEDAAWDVPAPRVELTELMNRATSGSMRKGMRRRCLSGRWWKLCSKSFSSRDG